MFYNWKNKFKFYKQHDRMDCGPTCLQMIAKYYGKSLAIDKLRKFSDINRSGVSIYGLGKAAEKIGFKSLACKITFNQLINEVQLPCIIHWQQNHLLVVTQPTKKNKIIIADPAEGVIKVDREDFLRNWISSSESQKGVALLLEPTSSFYNSEEDKTNNRNWTFLLRYLRNYRSQIAKLFLALFVGSFFQLIFPFLTQSIVDVGINSHDLNFIQLILLAQFILFFSQIILEFIRGQVLLYVSTHVNLSILSDFWMKLMKLPLNFFDTKNVGDILQRVQDNRRIESFITGAALHSFFSVFSLIIFSIVLLSYSTTVFLIFSISSLLYLAWIRFFLKFRRALDYKHFSIASKENTATMQLIYGMQEIKLNNAEQSKRWKWEEIQAQLFKLNFKMLSLGQYQTIGAFFINQGKNIIITYLVAKSVLDGNLTLGAMLSIQYIIGQLNSPLDQLIQFTQQAQDAKISLERLNEIHDLEDEVSYSTQLTNHLSENKMISINNLSFSYPGSGNIPILKNINLSIPAGKITAIVGTSGSGKTTLLKLLQKFYENYEGDIKIGDRNLKYFDPHFWRDITGSVMQEGFIFSDSIEKNISISDEEINYEKLVQACKVANILNFIESLPLGFETKIGAEGNGISAGQKQRILIARAVYKNPEFILFDEATNALDSDNERVIMENLQSFFAGKTVIIVAHRLSTVRDADKIIVLQEGKIIEEGSHVDLSFRKGRYYQLVKNQLELGN